MPRVDVGGTDTDPNPSSANGQAPGGAARDVDGETHSRRNNADVEVEREVTKRQIVQSVTTVVVMVLYMVFTLFRERDAGVVVLDPDEGSGPDDWAE